MRHAPHAPAIVFVCLFTLTTLAAGCGLSSPPRRASPLATVSEVFPDGARVAQVDPDHGAWAYELATSIELHDADGLVAVLPASDPWMLFDVAPDRTAAVCTSDAIHLLGGAMDSTVAATSILPEATIHGCGGIVTRGEGDVWVILDDSLCHLASGSWTCEALEQHPAGSLVRTDSQLWWLASGGAGGSFDLVARDETGEGTPAVVEAGIGWGELRATSSDHGVLFVPHEAAADPRPMRLKRDGTRTVFEVDSENGRYWDVWLARDGRVLAVDIASDGYTSRLSFGSTSSSSSTYYWTQLVVYELRESDAPREIAHVDYGGGGHVVVPIERADGTFLSGDRWWQLP